MSLTLKRDKTDWLVDKIEKNNNQNLKSGFMIKVYFYEEF